jgi:DNA adenine methylase
MSHYSPLRYPGGKGKVAEYFKDLFRENSLYDGIYIEPYAGGASVALSLLFGEYVSKVVINDIDRSIYAFWYSVLYRTDELCKLIRDTEVTVANWQVQKTIQKNRNRYGLLKLGFSTFFLNRTNRSGILNAGVIGGLAQEGGWKINARYNKADLMKRIERIASYKNKIDLHNVDALKLVKSLSKSLPQKSIFFLDPPYYQKGKELYLNFYEPEDHKKIAEEIKKVENQKWIITYDSVVAISKLYKNFRQKKFILNYSAGVSNKGQEIMIFSNNIRVSKQSIIKR